MLLQHNHTDCTCNTGLVLNRNSDPTRTTTLRNAFARKMNGKFDKLIALIRKAVVAEDVFALNNINTNQAVPPGYRAFEFMTSAEKVEAFMRWLQHQIDIGILEIGVANQIGEAVNEIWSNIYIEDSYKRGVMRARYEMDKAGIPVPPLEVTGGIGASMSTLVHLDRVGLLFTRTYEELKGVTNTMSSQISRILSQGMIDGDNPNLLARKMVSTINGSGIGELGITDKLGRFIPAKRRAEMIARTETIRAHHLATIQEYRNWGVLGIKVQAEWLTAGDSRVCARCQSLEGNIYTLDEIEPMIPLHPMCRCMALPTLV